MKVYICGPMTGVPDKNFPAFAAATEAWRAEGYEVVSPAEMDIEDGFDKDSCPTEADMRYIFANDMQQVCFIDAIALLPGWQRSKFGQLEVLVGLALGCCFFDAVTMEEIMPMPSAITWTVGDACLTS